MSVLEAFSDGSKMKEVNRGTRKKKKKGGGSKDLKFSIIFNILNEIGAAITN